VCVCEREGLRHDGDRSRSTLHTRYRRCGVCMEIESVCVHVKESALKASQS